MLLSEEDVISLSKNKSVSNKAETLKKVTAYYVGNELTTKGVKLAEDIFRIIVEDVELKLRETLSESLKNCKNVPHDVVRKIIDDKESVAIPFITHYQNLSKEELIGIIDAHDINKQKAVANRQNLNEDIAEYIVKRCAEDVVDTLVSNDSANIKENTLNDIITKYPQSEQIKKHLVYRSHLPVSIIENIVDSLSDELQKTLIFHHSLPDNVALNLVEKVKEKVTLKISKDYSTDERVEELVRELYNKNRLTSSLAVRSICTGDLKFFEYAISYLSNTNIAEVRKILFNLSADFMIRNLLRKAFIPKNLFPAVFSAIKVLKDIHFEYQKGSEESFSHKVISRILSYDKASEELSQEDIDYLISKFS